MSTQPTSDSSPDPSQPNAVPEDDAVLAADDAAEVDSVDDDMEADEYLEDEEFEEEEYEEYVGRSGLSRIVVNFGSCGLSMLVHLVGLLVLGYLTVPELNQEVKTLVEAVFEPRPEDEPVEFELDEQIEAVTEQTISVVSASPMVGVAVGVQGTAGVPTLDQEVMKEAAATDMGEISIEHPLAGAPSFDSMVEAVPDGEFKGDPRAVIDDYQQAMDRLSQELMWMMDKGPVLVIWAFDESGSMKDDQQEIRERINNVYVQMGLVGRDESQWLETSVVSYGAGYRLHVKRPTSNVNEIRQAIDAVPEDETGQEMMCQAVGRAISQHREYAKKTGRQMALILVTDESGEHEDNYKYLEPAITEAKAARCRIYVLGREAVFGYPYVYMRWKHPQTKRMHWLRVNRGPETGFVEQLQIDGFRRRHDAFSSGFGPYEQTRMARETGGIFFMLPSVESALVRGEKRRYELEIMRPYRPDLRARVEVLSDRDTTPLRKIIWTCIYDLNPYRKDVAVPIEMRVHFSPQFPEFVRQARVEQAKAKRYLVYLARVQKALEEGATMREREADPRWQGNYDLMYAQLIAYQARIWEYGASLEEFIKNPKTASPTKAPNLQMVHWDVITRKQTLTEESKPYIERSTELFNVVKRNHPGTPYAGRADWELKRGFGVDFRPDYEPIYKGPKPTIPVPKL